MGRCHLFLSDQSTGIAWGCYGTFPGTQLTVGSGEANTSLIVAVCIEMSKDTLTDWRTIVIALLSLIFVFVFKKMNSAFIVIASAIFGYLLSLI